MVLDRPNVRFRLSRPRSSSDCVRAVNPTMSVNITAARRRSDWLPTVTIPTVEVEERKHPVGITLGLHKAPWSGTTERDSIRLWETNQVAERLVMTSPEVIFTSSR